MTTHTHTHTETFAIFTGSLDLIYFNGETLATSNSCLYAFSFVFSYKVRLVTRQQKYDFVLSLLNISCNFITQCIWN